MADETFIINIVADPKPAEDGASKVEQKLKTVEEQAAELSAAIARAYAVSGDRAQLAATQVSRALGLAEGKANTTHAALVRALDQRATRTQTQTAIEGIEKALGVVEQRASRVGQFLSSGFGRVLQGVTFAVAARAVVGYADAYTNLGNRIRSVADDQTKAASIFAQLASVANATRSDLRGTTEIYARLALSAKQLGQTDEDLIRFTKSLNQAIVLSGASASEASAGLIQLSQGIASGALRGDELRSVLEQLPAVADVIAKRLGVTRGQLRELGADGKLTAGVIIDAFRQARSELEERFGRTVPTVSQAFTVLGNRAIETVGSIDSALGVTRGLSTVLISLADNLDLVAVAVGTVGAVLSARLVSRVLPDAIGLLSKLGTIAAANPFIVLAAGISAAGVATVRWTSDLARASDTITQVDTAADKFANTVVKFRRLDEIARLQDVLSKDPGNEAAARRLEVVRAQLAGLVEEGSRYEKQQRQIAENNARATETYQTITKALDDEARLLRLSNDEREVQERLLKAEAALKKEKQQIEPNILQGILKEVEGRIRSNAELKKAEEALGRLMGSEKAQVEDVLAITKAVEDGTISYELYSQALDKVAAKVKAASLAKFRAEIEQTDEAIKALRLQADRPLFGDIAGDAARRIAELDKQGGFAGFSPEQRQAAEQRIQSQAAEQALLQARIGLLQQVQGPTQAYEEALAAANAQLEKTPGLQDALVRSVTQYRIQMLETNTDLGSGFERAFLKAQLAAQDFAAVSEQTIGVFASTTAAVLNDALDDGKVGWRELGATALDELKKIFLQLLINQAVAAAGGIFGYSAPAVGAVAGARQHGGTVQPGRTYLVGEQGPEPFTPGQTGTITPNPKTLAPQQRPEVNLQINNLRDPNELPTAINSGEVDEAVVNLIGRNAAKIRARIA